jgi:hypothetical protein
VPSRIFALLAAAVLVSGCGVTAHVIEQEYGGFNDTIHSSQSQQMLLNLVRLRYRESPLFMKVGALSASYSMESNARAGKGSAFNWNVWSVDIGGRLATAPTITYTPIEGNTFSRQLMAEVEANTFVLLFRAGWPMRLLGSVLVESVGNLYNHDEDPTYAEFQDLIERLHLAQQRRAIDFIVEDKQMTVRISESARDLFPELTLGKLDGELMEFRFRSLLDVMFFLAKNVEVPAGQQSWTRPATENGWLRVSATGGEPGDAVASVRYRGHYYSIAHSDIRSKDTFSLLKLLYEMQAGDIRSQGPVLTLPVAQPR